jgi:hypothetical protein
MNTKFIIAIALGSLLSCATAQEKKKNYAEIGYGWAAYEEAGWRLVPRVLKFSVGQKISENIAVEGMGAFGIASSSIGGVTLQVNNAFGAYVKPFIDISDSAEIYGRLGYVRVSGTASGAGGSLYGYDSGVSYGGGGAFKIGQDNAVFLDYMVYYNQNGVYVYGATSGVRFGF